MTTVVGGHRGMDVIRDGGGVILKRGHNLENKDRTGWIDNIAALQNEAKFLRVMSGSGFTPEVLKDVEVEGDDGCVHPVGVRCPCVATLTQSDLGDSEPMKDGELFRRNCVKVLYEIRQRNVRHGDLNGPNILIRDDWPWVVDWQEAHFIGEPAPQKQPYSDSFLLWRTVAGTAGETGSDLPRVARRWLAVLGALGGIRWAVGTKKLPLAGLRLLDLGCFQGDFVAAGAAEGMEAVGVDSGGFRSGEDSIAQARELWPWIPPTSFVSGDIMGIDKFNCDVVLMFSTWSYIVRDYGKQAAEDLIHRIVGDCGVLFFENQLKGDGPGPEFLADDDATGHYLCGFASQVKPLITIPVSGRPASRTVWEVRK